MMPEMSGWDVLDRLKSGPHAQIRVVIVSGSYGLEAMKPDPRADAVFEKPFNLGDVIETVIRLCDGGVDPGL
jgi:CheY-like chemotaxis protein